MSESGSRDDVAATDRAETRGVLAYVLSKWRVKLRRLSDNRPRSDERGQSERILVESLLRVLDDESEAHLTALAAAAARYGGAPRNNRMDPDALCEEFSALRLIVWDVVKVRDQGTNEQSVTRILRFDRALSIVIRAAVKAGYAPTAAPGVAAPVEGSSDT